MRKRLVIGLAMALGFLISVPLFAHHGNASFATDKNAYLEGDGHTDGFTPAPIFC